MRICGITRCFARPLGIHDPQLSGLGSALPTFQVTTQTDRLSGRATLGALGVWWNKCLIDVMAAEECAGAQEHSNGYIEAPREATSTLSPSTEVTNTLFSQPPQTRTFMALSRWAAVVLLVLKLRKSEPLPVSPVNLSLSLSLSLSCQPWYTH